MLEVIRAYIQQEPVAAIGFAMTWLATGVMAIIRYVKTRYHRKERIAELLSEANILAKQTMFRYTKLFGIMDREIAENAKHNREPTANYMEVREEYYSRRENVSKLEARISGIDVNNPIHKNLLAALAARSDAKLGLATSEEFMQLGADFPTAGENFQPRRKKRK